MLLYAMPLAVHEKWKEENPRKRIPTDRPALVKELQTLLAQFRKTYEQKMEGKQRGKGYDNTQR